MTTVTNNSPQAINTSLFSLEKDTDEKAKLLNEKLNEVNSAIAEINKILDGINKNAGVVSVNGKQGIVVLDASDIGGLATVATSGSYNDLSNKPTIPAAQVPSDWNATSGVARILNKPSLASVATSGNYNDLSNKPTIPTATSQLTNDSGFVSPQNVLFNDADVPEGSGNLNTTATAHKITTYRNGLTIPYQMDNTNDGGLLRVRGNSEDNCILELGTWDDSGDGETIQFNYYPTTSKDTPTHSVSVPKKSGTIALTSDVPTRTSQLTNDSDFVTSSGRVANATYADTFRATYNSTISPAQAAAMTDGNRSWPLGYGKDYLQSVSVSWEDYGSHSFPAGAAGYFFPGYGSNGGTLVLVNYPSNRMLYNVWIDSNRWSGWHYVDLNPITYS